MFIIIGLSMNAIERIAIEIVFKGKEIDGFLNCK